MKRWHPRLFELGWEGSYTTPPWALYTNIAWDHFSGSAGDSTEEWRNDYLSEITELWSNTKPFHVLASSRGKSIREENGNLRKLTVGILAIKEEVEWRTSMMAKNKSKEEHQGSGLDRRGSSVILLWKKVHLVRKIHYWAILLFLLPARPSRVIAERLFDKHGKWSKAKEWSSFRTNNAMSWGGASPSVRGRIEQGEIIAHEHYRSGRSILMRS